MGTVRRIEVETPAVSFDIPVAADILTVPHPAPPLADAATAITEALRVSLGAPPRLGVILDGAHAIPCLIHTSTDA